MGIRTPSFLSVTVAPAHLIVSSSLNHATRTRLLYGRGWVFPQLRSWLQNRASLAAQTVKNLPEMQETQVQSLGQEDPLEKGMATHSSILVWEIP